MRYGAGVRWADFERQQPRFASLGREKLSGPGVVLVGTVRKDGTPRISPVEPLFCDGDLWLTMGHGSLKARDLQRDPRVLVHSIVTSRDGTDGEYKVRGRAIEEVDPSLNARIAGAVLQQLGWRFEVGTFHLFRIEVEDVTFMSEQRPVSEPLAGGARASAPRDFRDEHWASGTAFRVSGLAAGDCRKTDHPLFSGLKPPASS